MSNMSYCRFQNTEKDLRDCLNAIEEMINAEECGECFEDLSPEEKHALKRISGICKLITEYDVDIEES